MLPFNTLDGHSIYRDTETQMKSPLGLIVQLECFVRFLSARLGAFHHA